MKIQLAWWVLAAAIISASLPSVSAAADVALVAEDNKILQQITAGFQAAFKGSVETFTYSGPDTASKVSGSSPKVIVALGSAAAKNMAEAAKDRPLLYAGVLNPKKVGLEGSNVGGVPMSVPIKRQWTVALKGIRAKRLGVLASADNADAKNDAQEAGSDLGLKVKVSAVSGDDLAGALKALEDEVDAVWIPLDPAVAQQTQFKAIVDFCLKKKVPLIVPAPSYVKQGGLMSISMSYAEMGKVLAAQAKAVVEGSSARAASGKVATEEEVTANLAVAREVGVSFTADFLKLVTSKIE